MEKNEVEAIRDYYADTPNISLPTPTRSPSGVIYGADPVIESTYASKKLFPDRTLLGEDVIWTGNDDEGYFSSHRILSNQQPKLFLNENSMLIAVNFKGDNNSLQSIPSQFYWK